MHRTLTDAEYKALSILHHEFKEAFSELPDELRLAYYKRLYQESPWQ